MKSSTKIFMPANNNSQFDKNKIKVSVSLVTFNHENFIAQAIESVLLQEVDFSYEIIIGEDFSSDKTREIVVDYQNSIQIKFA